MGARAISIGWILGLALGAGTALAADAYPTGDLHKTYVFAPTGETMPYRLYVPKSYDPARPWPLIVVLHGAGGDENGAIDRSKLEAEAERRGYLVLAVLGYSPSGGYGDVYPVVTTKETAAEGGRFRAAATAGGPPPPRRGPPPPPPTGPVPVDDYAEQPASVLIDPHIGELSEQETLAAISEVRRSYNVDPNRTYLMGNSMGGVGTLYLAAKYPQMWTAISPSGGVIAAWSYPYTRLRDAGVSALFVHGEFDEHANPHWSEAMAAAAKTQGVDAQMLVVPHGSHGGAWIMALPQIFDFFDAHRRAQSGPPAPMAGVQPTNAGTAPDGTRWSLAKPAAWNGTLLIYSRGGAPAQSQGQPIQLAPRDSAPLLLAHGYALAGTAYRSHGWNPEANALGQFAALPAIESALGAKPKRVVNLGTSYGGLVGAIEVDRTKGNIDGSVLTCGLVVGGIDAMNAQLDGAHAINQLLTDKHDIALVHLDDGAGVKASADALGVAIAQARETPAGRARLALVSALMHMSTWKSGPKPAADDLDAQAAQQVDWLVKGMGPGGGLFGFMQGSRLDIETEAGGNPSWTRGVDYAALLKGNEYAGMVEALYRKAGLDLAADLAVLSRTADIAADPAAVAWMRRTSVPSGRLPVPVLVMQTSGDPVAPHAYLVAYAGRADRAGSADQLRTAMVDRPGHCSFKPEEILATVQAMDARLEAGRWSAGATSPSALQAAAGPAAAFVPPPTAPFAVHAL